MLTPIIILIHSNKSLSHVIHIIPNTQLFNSFHGGLTPLRLPIYHTDKPYTVDLCHEGYQSNDYNNQYTVDLRHEGYQFNISVDLRHEGYQLNTSQQQQFITTYLIFIYTICFSINNHQQPQPFITYIEFHSFNTFMPQGHYQ